MKITNARKDTQGDWKFDLDLKDEEVDFLINISIHSLIKLGLVQVQEQDDPQTIDVIKSIKESNQTQVH